MTALLRASENKISRIVDTDYQVRISDAPEDPEWDSFVARVPGGHHVQTSLWGQVKATLRWRAVRVIVTSQGCIVGGAQLLVRPMPPIGAVGYVTKGPLCDTDDPTLAKLIIDELHRVSRKNHVQYLVVQPPNNGQAIAAQLPGWGFRHSSIRVAPFSTAVIALTPDFGDLLAQMRKETRRKIRRSEREGISVREGTENDLDTFYRLHVTTSRRQKFVPYPKEYFAKMFQVLEPPGYLKLLLAEYEGETVSGLLIAPFADTVVAKIFGWSGHHAIHLPNEALVWASLKWAKSHGYRRFDQDGIDPVGARAIFDGKPLPESLLQSPTSFKLGFGGQVVLYPEPYEYVYNPFLRWAYSRVSPKTGDWPLMRHLLNYLRKR